MRLIVLDFFVMHVQDVLLLDYRLDWKKAQVLWASAKNKELIFLREDIVGLIIHGYDAMHLQDIVLLEHQYHSL